MDEFLSGQLCYDMRLDLLRGLREGSNNSWDMRLRNANSLFKIGFCGDSRKRYEQGASFPPDSRAAQNTTRPVTTQTVSYKWLFHPINKDLLPVTEHGSSKKNRKHPVWKDATLDGRRKSRSAAWAELYMLVLAIVKEFSSGISPRLGSFILSMASGLVLGKAQSNGT